MKLPWVPKGPKFSFDIYPRVQDNLATQVVNIGPEVGATQEVSLTAQEVGAPEKTGIGKETFERAIVNERKRSQKTTVSILAAAVLVLLTLGYTFRDSILPEPPVVEIPEMPRD